MRNGLRRPVTKISGRVFVGSRGEEVARGDRVRAVVLHVDPQDLAAQVVRVAGAATRVETGVVADPVVVRRVAVGAGRARRRVVARGEQQVAVVVEGDVTGDVAALTALDLDLDDHLLAREVERVRLGVPREAAELVVALPLVPVRLVGTRRAACSAPNRSASSPGTGPSSCGARSRGRPSRCPRMRGRGRSSAGRPRSSRRRRSCSRPSSCPGEGSVRRTWPPRVVCSTRESGSTARSIGSPTSFVSVTRS